MSASAAKTTSSDAPNVMTRRRAHILERAQAQLSSSACHLPNQKDEGRRVSQTTEEISPSYASGSASRSETSADDGESADSTPEEQRECYTNEQSVEKRHRAWYEFDLAVLAALVSLACQWLTGGDYVKNLFMLVLLVYYLHQIIEVPWEIYQKARIQRPILSSLPATIEEKYQQIGASELRKIEILFLCLTTLSPFLGAAFIRYATAAIIGPESISWFNVGLFVLATGVRPWAHLVERLKKRTSDLHEVVQYPVPPNVITTGKLLDRLDELTRRISKLEKIMRKNETKAVELREDVYHDVNEISLKIQGIARKQEKRQARQESRVKGMEDTLKRIKSVQPRQDVPIPFRLFPLSLLCYVAPSWLYLRPYRILIHFFYPSPIQRNGGALKSSSDSKRGEYPNDVGLLYHIGRIATLPFRAIMSIILGTY